MKKCTTCGDPKPEEAFNWKNKAKGQRQPVCRDCHKIAKDQHYQQNKEKYKQRADDWHAARTVELNNYLLDYLLCHPCGRCGEDNILLLEFDHLDRSDKEFEISTVTSGHRSVGVDTLRTEVAKCQVLCVACHRIKTLMEDQTSTRVRLLIERGLLARSTSSEVACLSSRPEGSVTPTGH